MNTIEQDITNTHDEQGHYVVFTCMNTACGDMLKTLLDDSEKNISVSNSRILQELGISWEESVEHEEKHGIDTFFLPYLEAIDSELNIRDTVIDINSWSVRSIPIVDKAFSINCVQFVAENGISSVKRMMNYFAVKMHKDIMENRVIKKVWIDFGSPGKNWELRSPFEKWCFYWGVSHDIHKWLESEMGKDRVSILHLEELDHNSSRRSSLISDIQNGLTLKQNGDTSLDTKEVVDIWEDYSAEEKRVFIENCTSAMSYFGYSIPGESSEVSMVKNDIPEKFNRDNLPVVSIENLHSTLGFTEKAQLAPASVNKTFSEWKMEDDDSPIFKYLYRNFDPGRHLEFGTWQGTGTVYALEESKATVWTINLLGGETDTGGYSAYGHDPKEKLELDDWARKMSIGVKEKGFYRTDTIGFIGRQYLSRNFGNRVCQIYSDSLKWDDSNYPDGFFDSILIDGGHTKEIVLSDTSKALRLVRSGGLIMWHDVCPDMYGKFETVTGVLDALEVAWPVLREKVNKMFWIKPSFIFAAIVK
jgi:Methyltransferase domain